MMTQEKTFGEKRIRTSFNPSSDDLVQNIKDKCAELLDLIQDNVDNNNPSAIRLKCLALDAIEEGAMWAVKAATE